MTHSALFQKSSFTWFYLWRTKLLNITQEKHLQTQQHQTRKVRSGIIKIAFFDK